MPICGIDEATQDEEQSPDFKWKELPCIEEENKNYIFPKKDSSKGTRITMFLDSMGIKQVFPSEINSIKLAFYTKKQKALVPSLSLWNNSLLNKRKSSKVIPLSKLM